MTDDDLDALIHSVDLDGLVRLIDDRATAGDWAGLDRVRRRTIAATRESGRQLWPAATLAEYRIALDATPDWVSTVLDDEAGRFTIGPLSEVAAVNHVWSVLASELPPTPTATYLAHERVLRGEQLDSDSLAPFPPVLDLPPVLAAWEPDYPLSTYEADGAEHPEPRRTVLGADHLVEISHRDPIVVDDDDTALAFRQLVEPWTIASTGRAESICVEGTHLDALSALGVRRGRVCAISSSEALADLAWAGASGGARGRRRGMASGRFSMWWLLGAIGDLHDDWPPETDEIETLLSELRWFRWDAHEPASGWRIQLAVTDTVDELSWAFNAADDDTL